VRLATTKLPPRRAVFRPFAGEVISENVTDRLRPLPRHHRLNRTSIQAAELRRIAGQCGLWSGQIRRLNRCTMPSSPVPPDMAPRMYSARRPGCVDPKRLRQAASPKTLTTDTDMYDVLTDYFGHSRQKEERSIVNKATAKRQAKLAFRRPSSIGGATELRPAPPP
jgi:hypothetical protein